MAERILRPLTAEGRVTIPKELREKHNLKDYVEIFDTEDGILIKAHQAVIKEGNGGTKITDINIPGPGSALAIAIGIAFYSSAFAKDISTEFRYFLLVMGVILLFGLYKIEQLHVEKEIKKLYIGKEKNNNELSTTIQDEKEQIGEVKLTQQQNFFIVIYIAVISMGIGFFGNVFANYAYDELLKKFPFYWGYYGTFFIFLGFIFSLSYLGYKIGYSKTKKLVDESEKRGKQDTDEP